MRFYIVIRDLHIDLFSLFNMLIENFGLDFKIHILFAATIKK